MNDRGFAVTGILYIVLILFLSLYASMLAMFASRRKVLEQIKKEVIGDVQDSGNVLGIKANSSYIGKYVTYKPSNATWNMPKDSISTINETGFNIYDTTKKTTLGSDKTESITCNSNYQNSYNGFRIMNVDLDGTMTLIHAGTPECYTMDSKADDSNILRANSTVKTNSDNNAWEKYGNNTYAASVHYMNENDYNTILKNQNSNNDFYLLNEDSKNSTCYGVNSLNCGNTNELIQTNSSYFITSDISKNKESLYIWKPEDSSVSSADNVTSGLRPVIRLKNNVKIGIGDGSIDTPYQLVI